MIKVNDSLNVNSKLDAPPYDKISPQRPFLE